MAKLTEYGELDYNQIIDYTIDNDTIDMILSFLEFPIIEEKINDDGIIISAFEKSFWGKKPKGHIILSYIEDVRLDITQSKIMDAIIEIDKFNKETYEEEYIAKFSDILIGFDFYKIDISRKRIFSYGLLNHNINVKYDAATQVHSQEMQNGFGSVRERYMSKYCDEIRKLQSIFKIFEKI